MTKVLLTSTVQDVVEGFLEYAHKRNFVLDEDEAKEPGKHLLLAPQVTTAKKILTKVFTKSRATINISIVRQLGKTEIVALVVSYIFTRYYELFKEPFRVVVVAPEKNTGLLVFDRITDYVPVGFFDKKKKGEHFESRNGDFIDVFSMYDKRVGGTYEGRTINMTIRDEAHLGDDGKFKDQIRPTMIRTNGVVINIGNGSWRKCLFTKGLQMGNQIEKIKIGGFEYEMENIVIRRTYDHLKDYMTKLAERGNRECADWLAGVESDLRDGGRRSLENRKNIFCEIILEKESFITEEEFDACVVENYTGTPKEIVSTIDMAKAIDRTIAGFGDLTYTLFDIKILKEAFERKDIMQQMDEYVDYTEDMGYAESLEAIGGDATGMGETAVEALSIAMAREIVPMKFSLQSKHKWYTELQSRILTKDPARRIKFPKNLPNLGKLKKELCELTIKSSASGEHLMFQAPSGKEKFDDMCAMLAMYVNLVGQIIGFTRNQISYEERHPWESNTKNKLSNVITPPAVKREINARGTGLDRFAGNY